MQTKPILFIAPTPPPFGGIAVWTQHIFNSGFPDGTRIEIVDTKITVKRNIFDKAHFSFAEILRTLQICIKVLLKIIQYRPKLVHLNCSLSPLGVFRDVVCLKLSRLFRLPVIIHYHGNIPDFPKQLFLGMSQRALIALLKGATANIVVNRVSFESIHEMCPKNRGVFLLPNFVPDIIFKNPNKPSIKPDHRLQALFCGGITANKGCGSIHAMSTKFPEIDFHFIGKMHQDMESIFKNLRPNIFLHSELSHEKILQAMPNYDFLIFPSLSEGFPLSVLEAMAIGIPVIATKVGAIPEMIDDGLGGILVEKQNESDLIQAISTLQKDKSLLIKMGNYNRKKSFKEYRYSSVILKLLAIYKKFTQEKC